MATKDDLKVAGDVLTEFLEVAIHGILYVREVYAQRYFQKRKKYNIPVWMCRHPMLNQYIADVILDCRPWIEKDLAKAFIIVISKDGKPVENFVFDIENLAASIAGACGEDLESLLRAFMLKINVSDGFLKPNPPDCTFSVVVETKEVMGGQSGRVTDGEKMHWMNTEAPQNEIGNAAVIPLKSLNLGQGKVQLLVQESQMK